MSTFPIVDAARTIIAAELDLYAVAHGHRRPVTVGDLSSAYDAAHRAMGRPPSVRAEAVRELARHAVQEVW